MSEAALYGVDPLTSLFEAADDLWNVVGVPVTQSKLAIAIVLTDSVDETLGRDKKSKVVAAADPADHDLVMEGHLDRNAVFLT